MIILCDTSSVLMLLRIAPEMFIDPQYKCLTLPEVKKEILQTTKFKDKYSWRVQFKPKLKTIGMTEYNDQDFKLAKNTIKTLIDACTVNKSTGKIFDLSYEDIIVASYTVTKVYKITTEDKNLAQFLDQEFKVKNLSSLEVLNIWIKKKVLEVDANILNVLGDWKILEEPVQPSKAIKDFEKLTNHMYPGS
ncbi:MAG: hypothetical protein O6940_02505 [Ignavibacteria bacterium]|nr:hypothetical protein [Ignavibacteria bacterium]